jgi:hypothetical protein
MKYNYDVSPNMTHNVNALPTVSASGGSAGIEFLKLGSGVDFFYAALIRLNRIIKAELIF